MKSKSIIYYTSNREDAAFEEKVIEGIKKVKGDLDVISVSQKPLNFGHNICVGDVGYSYLNAFRQCLVGAKAATTEYVIMTESDCLYPDTGYFDYEPTDPNPETIYTYDQVWILFRRSGLDSFRRKEQTHGSLIYNREFLIRFLTKILKGLPEWSNIRQHPIPWWTYPAPPGSEYRFCEFHGKHPIINVITGANGRRGTKVTGEKAASFEYWGSGRELKIKLFGGV